MMTTCSPRPYMTECDVMTIPTEQLGQGMESVHVCWGCLNQVPQTGCLQQQKRILT